MFLNHRGFLIGENVQYANQHSKEGRVGAGGMGDPQASLSFEVGLTFF